VVVAESPHVHLFDNFLRHGRASFHTAGTIPLLTSRVLHAVLCSVERLWLKQRQVIATFHYKNLFVRNGFADGYLSELNAYPSGSLGYTSGFPHYEEELLDGLGINDALKAILVAYLVFLGPDPFATVLARSRDWDRVEEESFVDKFILEVLSS